MATVDPISLSNKADSALLGELSESFPPALLERDFLDQLRFYKHRADQGNLPVSLAVLDLAGAEPGRLDDLKELAGALRRTLKASDVIGKLGDGRIAVLLPDTDLHGVERLTDFVKRSDTGIEVEAGLYPDQLFTQYLPADEPRPLKLTIQAPPFRKSVEHGRFFQQLRLEMRGADRSGTPIGLIVLHTPEDCGQLASVVNQLKKPLRDTDLVARLDFSTLAVLLPDTPPIGVETVANALREAAGNEKIMLTAANYPDQLFVQLLSDSEAYDAGMPGLPTTLTEPLAKTEFLERVRWEKRRSDRSKVPFSIIHVKMDRQPHASTISALELARHLRYSLRSTDILGVMADNSVGVLLPYADGCGARRIIEKLRAANSFSSLTMAASTYPDALFERLFSDMSSDDHTAAELVCENPSPVPKVQLAIKRVIDIIGALTGIVVFGPVMLATAAAVKLTSPGPAVFRQTRVGRNGERFEFLKFRSMYCNNDDRIHRDYVTSLIQGEVDNVNQGAEDKPLFKIKEDPRVTPVGRFIRKTSLDELPQFFNVLRGNMSLVGPRPSLPYEVEQYQSWHLRRVLEMQPGITGLWQVEGRSSTNFDEMVRLDLRYVRNWSLWKDFRIILRTIPALLGAKGAM